MKWITLFDIAGLFVCVALIFGIFYYPETPSQYSAPNIEQSTKANAADRAAASSDKTTNGTLAGETSEPSLPTNVSHSNHDGNSSVADAPKAHRPQIHSHGV